MAKWLQLLLNEGNIGGKQVVKRETIAETLKPQMLLSSITYPAAQQAKPHFFAYGLGWFLQDYKGRLLAMHTGSLYGANSIVAIVPEEKLGLVMLVNADPVQYRHAFMYDVIDRFIGSRDKDWNADLWEVYSKLDAEANAERAEGDQGAPGEHETVRAAAGVHRQVLKPGCRRSRGDREARRQARAAHEARRRCSV